MRYLSVTKAAKITGIPLRTLQRWCKQKKLPSIKRGGVKLWLIDLQALKQKGGIAESELAFQLVAGRSAA